MIANYWSATLGWDDAAASTAASDQRRRADAIQQAYDDTVSAAPPLWLGDAANAAAADRELMAVRVRKLGSALGTFADVAGGAASELGTLKADQRATIDAAGRGGCSIEPNGWVTPRSLDGVKNYASTVGAVASFGARALGYDTLNAGKLGALAAAMWEEDLRLDAADVINTCQLAYVDGALDGADWSGVQENFDNLFGFGHPLPHLIGRDGLVFAMDRGGYPPRWMMEALYDGKLPTAGELGAFEMLQNRDGLEWLGDIPGIPQAVDMAMQGTWDDLQPATPVVERAIPGSPDRVADSASLMRNANHVYAYDDDTDPNDLGGVEVRVIDSDPPRFIAVVPGTTTGMDNVGGWGSNPSGTDWYADVKLMGTGASSGRLSAQAAIDLAIRNEVQAWEATNGPMTTKPEVVLAGHSQGGILVAQMAGDKFFAGRYDVKEVVTFGSPIDQVAIDRSINVTSIVGQDDQIHKLDAPVVSHNDADVVEFSGDDRRKEPSAMAGHEQQTYQMRIEDAQAGVGSNINGSQQTIRDLDARLAEFAGDHEQRVTAVGFGRQG